MLELYEPFRENLIISLFSTVKIWGLRVKTVFFVSVFGCFSPLDPDSGSQNLTDPDLTY